LEHGGPEEQAEDRYLGRRSSKEAYLISLLLQLGAKSGELPPPPAQLCIISDAGPVACTEFFTDVSQKAVPQQLRGRFFFFFAELRPS
jgi:hypothetical protein